MKLLPIALTALACLAPALAQDPPEYGEFEELRGLDKIYVQSYDLEERKMVIKEIEEHVRKNRVALQIVNAPEEADMHLLLASSVSGAGLGRVQYGEVAVAVRGKPIEGITVNPEGARRYRYRIVFSARSQRDLGWKRNPVKKAVQRFLKELGALQRRP